MAKEPTLTSLEKLLRDNFKVIGKRFDAVDKRFDAVDKEFKFVHSRLNNLDKKIDAVSQDLAVFKDVTLTHLDGVVRSIERLDQEHVFTLERIKRIEK